MVHQRDFGRAEIAFLVGVPIAWAILLLFHPGGEGKQIYADVDGDGTRLLVVHVGTMAFIPLMALAIGLLLKGLRSPAAQVSRIALVVFVVFYVAWESLQGIANGILVDQVSALPGPDRALGADLIQDFAESPLVRDLGVLATIGSLALVVAAVAAGIALRDAGAPRWAPWVLGFSGFLITAHPPPYGPTGLILFAVLVVMLARGGAVRVPAEARQPRFDHTSPSTFGPVERAFLIAVPLVWAILLLFHPTGDPEDFYRVVSDELATWQIVHLGTLLLVPLMAGAVLLLLRGIEGRSAVVARAALAVFAVAYMAWEVLIGLGTGALVDQVQELSSSEQAIGAALVDDFKDSGLIGVLELIGTSAWLVALTAAGMALVRERGVSRAVVALLVLSAIPTAWHVTPFGQVGLALFIAAVLLVLRGGSSASERAPGQPAAA